MKRIILVAAVAAMVVVMAGGAFAATATGSVSLSASVQSKCGAITANALSVDIDPSTPSATSTGSDTTIQCTKNRAITVSASGAGKSDGTSAASSTASSGNTLNGYMVDGTSIALPYSLTFNNSFTGAGFGAATPSNLIQATGLTVANADAQAASFGVSYADTVVLTVTY